MRIAKNFKLLFLSGLLWDAEDAEISLFEALKAAARARLTDTAGGKVLVSSASNGFSGTFALPAAGQGLTPQDIAELCGEMLGLYAKAKADLIARGTAAPSDDEIHNEMALLIDHNTATEVRSDFSDMRF